MIQSMTGFGRGTAPAAGVEVTVEVRSVNSRHTEVSVRAPRELGPHEVEIQNRARSVLERGKINVSVQLEQAAGQLEISLDASMARALARALERLRAAAGIEQSIQIDHLLQFKELFSDSPVGIDGAELWEATAAALDAAVQDCRDFRLQEGRALAEDLHARLDGIERQLDAIEATAPQRVTQARENMRERLAELLAGTATVDPERLETEIAILADRLDVNEECVRLRSHLALFHEALQSGGAVGRRLNFLAQELHREVNTIASKANDAIIAQRAVSIKEELEKIREQVQNLV